MRNYGLGVLIVGIMTVSFGFGYLMGITEPDLKQAVPGDNKPVLGVEKEENIIDEETRVILETEYLKCGHLIISEYEDRKALEGKSINELEQKFGDETTLNLDSKENTLTIRQVINDWCSADKEKCRLGEYQGKVAIFKGPNPSNDTLLRVTGIEMSILPASIADQIRNGQYEFENEEALNDALENLDEYL